MANGFCSTTLRHDSIRVTLVIPAQAGIQNTSLDSGFRVKHGMTVTPFIVPTQAGIQYYDTFIPGTVVQDNKRKMDLIPSMVL